MVSLNGRERLFRRPHRGCANEKTSPKFSLREKKPARARVLGSPTIARAKFLARAFAQIPMICYARYLLQTYPSSSVPFFKQMYVLLVTNLCSKACKLWVSFFACWGGAREQRGAGQLGKNCNLGKQQKKRERTRCDQRVKFVFLCQKLRLYFSKLAIRISIVRSSCSSSCREVLSQVRQLSLLLQDGERLLSANTVLLLLARRRRR